MNDKPFQPLLKPVIITQEDLDTINYIYEE